MAQSSALPLSVGNVVTTGFQLYKNRFRPYFLLALKAYLWLLVPVYGWAKFCTLSALISRLVYGELVNQPETVAGGTKYVNSRLWQFLVAAILLGLIALGAYIALAIVVVFITGVVGGLISSLADNFAVNLIAITLAIIIGVIVFVGCLSISMRFFIFEVPLAIEYNIEATSTIRRSWELTQDSEGRILLISFVGFLITFPFLVLVQLVSRAFQFYSATWREQNPTIWLLAFILTLGLSFVAGALQLPFWQAVKAIIYYDLRTRKEGLGLNLRDRNI